MSRVNWRSVGAILAVAVTAEVVLPWVLIEISNLFVFDIPSWSLWAIYAGPPLVAAVAVVVEMVLARWLGGRPAQVA